MLLGDTGNPAIRNPSFHVSFLLNLYICIFTSPHTSPRQHKARPPIVFCFLTLGRVERNLNRLVMLFELGFYFADVVLDIEMILSPAAIQEMHLIS